MKIIQGVMVVIGDEILCGHVQDINVEAIGRLLLKKGFRLKKVCIVGDDRDSIVNILREGIDEGDFVITTGGLGPTKDDITCEAICGAFGLRRISNEAYRKAFRSHLESLSISWKEEFNTMTQLPEGSVKLALDKPMAGFKLHIAGKPLYCLPGVPHEVEYLLQKEVLPELENVFYERGYIGRNVLRIQHLHEWEIAERLDVDGNSILRNADISIGYLPRPEGETWVTITVVAGSPDDVRNTLKELEHIIRGKIGEAFISGGDDEPLESVVGEILLSREMKLGVAESCTGGMLAERIVSVPGASDYFDCGFVVYSNKAKVDVLGVLPKTIEYYGAVSEQTAIEMVEGVLKQSQAQIAVGITGIAGPSGGTPQKPVGTVCIGCGTKNNVTVKSYQFSGNRRLVQEKAVHAALVLLWEILRK